ncbi:MAG: UDP-4-amino-4,6-dideoxy-N-acetyl-beta-L-altrosamine transaminase [Gammaproteobacteria bacterium]|nr:UDP-4-amino-4,6-dideoxy-N-acetyl-beta-L-altrosamine transaminase [Gammaproteobacteria bacterium]
MIPYGKQDITQSDIDAVVEVLQSDYLTQGPKGPLFEKTVAKYCDAEYGIAVNSATSALHIACLALDLGKGDFLWTTPVTFVASANCGLYCGAEVDFVDIDPRTYNMSVDALEEKLLLAEKTFALPKVVVVVHLCGQPCDMEQIYRLSQKFGFNIIEDASHAIGGRYKNEAIGACRYSDITVFSFHPVKIITTGEGGMALTNNKRLAEKMELFRSHGITRDAERMTQDPDGSWYYQQIDLGFNYRMTELQAALGVSQMSRLDEYVQKRHLLAEQYNRALADLPLTLPWQHPDSYSGMHLYVIRLELEKISSTHKEIFESLRQLGIGVNLHYIPVHTQPYYQKKGFKFGDYPEAECYYREAISIPLYHGMTTGQQETVISALHEILK